MASGRWQGSTRRDRLPKNWPAIRARILKRDGYACQHQHDDGIRCGAPANQVDHIINGDDHSDSNLQALCEPHHKAKSAREGSRAAHARRIPRNRPPEKHPGLL
jgi:5-methylcytosine-specific restriction endonuclease McrA